MLPTALNGIAIDGDGLEDSFVVLGDACAIVDTATVLNKNLECGVERYLYHDSQPASPKR